jgi:hypothetical protein
VIEGGSYGTPVENLLRAGYRENESGLCSKFELVGIDHRANMLAAAGLHVKMHGAKSRDE